MALRLYRSPVLARSLRRLPLHDNVIEVVRIAGGCPKTMARAVETTRLDEFTLLKVASLYLLVVLFGPDADSRRTLGLAEGDDQAAAQEHRRWLLKWLHPDRNDNPALHSFSVRVLDAWAKLSLESASMPKAVPNPEPGPSEQPGWRAAWRPGWQRAWRRGVAF